MSYKISISGLRGSQKSEISREVMKILGIRHYFSSGDYFRHIAERRNVPLIRLEDMACKEPSFDFEIDSKATDFSLRHSEAGFILEGMMAWICAPKAIKVFISCVPEIRAHKIYELNDCSHDSAVMALSMQESALRTRFNHRYSVPMFTDPEHFDLVVDSFRFPIKKVVEQIICFIKNHDEVSAYERYSDMV